MASPWHLYVAQLPRAYNIPSRAGPMPSAPNSRSRTPWTPPRAPRRRGSRRAPPRRARSTPWRFPRVQKRRAWAWAHATVSSRTVFVPFDPAGALCPVGDLFNYAPPPPAHAPTFLGTPLEGGDEEETRDRVRPGDDEEPDQKPAGDGAWDEASGEYRFHARRAYRAGDQIMLCYGRYTNLELLEHYGFLPRPSRATPTTSRSFRSSPARRDPGDGDGVVSTPRVRALPNGRLEWDDLRDVRVRGWEATRGAPRTRDARGGESRGHALGAAAEEAAFAALVDAAAAELLGLPTTAREDTAKMQRALMRRSSDDGRSANRPERSTTSGDRGWAPRRRRSIGVSIPTARRWSGPKRRDATRRKRRRGRHERRRIRTGTRRWLRAGDWRTNARDASRAIARGGGEGGGDAGGEGRRRKRRRRGNESVAAESRAALMGEG